MNPVPLFLIIVSLPLLLGGCGEKEVPQSKLVERQGITYLVNSKKPFTGKSSSFHKNGEKREERNYKDGNANGLLTNWHKNGQKRQQINYKDGKEDGLWIRYNEDGTEWGRYTF